MGTIVGPCLASQLQSAYGDGNVAIQGVDYAADATGITEEATGSGSGTEEMLSDVQSVLSDCPDTKVVLSGYSQGAMLVHNTLAQLSEGQVQAAVTFGDPFVGETPENLPDGAWKSFCATADPVCGVGGSSSDTSSQSTASHLGYGADAQTAADFVTGVVSA